MLMFILSPFSSFFTYNFSLLLYLAHLFTQTWSILQVINSMPLFIFHIMFGKLVAYLFVIWQFLSSISKSRLKNIMSYSGGKHIYSSTFIR